MVSFVSTFGVMSAASRSFGAPAQVIPRSRTPGKCSIAGFQATGWVQQQLKEEHFVCISETFQSSILCGVSSLFFPLPSYA